MKNKNRAIRFLFYLSVIILLTVYLFPGSLIGYLLYGDLAKQPNLISNPIGTSINHFICFFYLSLIGLFSHFEKNNFKKMFAFLFLLSLTLEILHLIVPKRSFEYLDLIANMVGVIFGCYIITIYKKRKKNG